MSRMADASGPRANRGRWQFDGERRLSVESVEPYALVLRLILIADQSRVPPRS
jgi:hypothetical protein